ncbi:MULTISPECIES: YibE/F family protein [Enterococcus]|uniref:YibE/F family protein n=1 Tax=Candidatus Enterococcus mangumiae TaxID=2230878 RepID=A0ABZ2SS30_9ENTE|nr:MULTISPECIES: YibE/F family protein [unclassified Enterococcus]MBO0488849.1 YibE/F family protein [Enterococcus sp. DIV1094]MBO1301195.1 YibE/F family protein [Enterococcus sp. DIV1271a]
MNVLLLLTLLLVLLIFLVGGKNGLYTILGLFANVLLFFLLLLLYHFRLPVLPSAVGIFLLITCVTLFFVNGYNLKMKAAFVSVVFFLVVFLFVTPLLSELAIQGFTRIELDELTGFDLHVSLDFLALTRAILLISVSGAVLDASVSIASATYEVYLANPVQTYRELVRSSLRIGRKILATTVTTLVFAFMGNCLALILWFIDLELSFGQLINEKTFVLEYVTVMITTSAAILVLPITSVISSFFFTRQEKSS